MAKEKREPKITDTHREYDIRLVQWTRARHGYEGEDAVKGAMTKGQETAGHLYLPPTPGMKPAAYKLYLKGAVWFNAYKQTIKGFEGMVRRKPLAVQGLAESDILRKDVDLAGTSLEEFADLVFIEVAKVGRVGVLVDIPPSPPGLSVADAEKRDIRPYVSLYYAEDIRNWEVQRIGLRKTLSRLVLREPGGEFDQYRELKLEPVKIDEDTVAVGCVVRVYTKAESNSEYSPGAAIVVAGADGRPLSEIPFWCFNSTNIKPAPEAPPFIDLLNMNFSHYRTTADLEGLRLMSGRATLGLFGDFGQDDATRGTEGGRPRVVMGTSEVLFSNDPTANADIVYLPADAVAPLEKAEADKRVMMAKLGARYLQDDPAGVEAFQTVLLKSNAENSVLAGIVTSESQGLSEILTLMQSLRGTPQEVVVTLNKEFFPEPIDPAMLAALLAAWGETGTITDRDLYEKFKRGGIIGEGTAFEAFVASVARVRALLQTQSSQEKKTTESPTTGRK